MRLSGIILLFTFSNILQAQTPAEAYISKFDSLAIVILNKYEIPASLVLGVAMQESGSGTSKLSCVNHNHFGVKARVKSSTTKSGYTTAYRKFKSDEAAYLHFGEMISKKKYYLTLKGNMDYMKWLRAMKSANYATSSQWINHVDKFIKRYDLTRFDIPAGGQVIPVLSVSDTTGVN